MRPRSFDGDTRSGFGCLGFDFLFEGGLRLREIRELYPAIDQRVEDAPAGAIIGDGIGELDGGEDLNDFTFHERKKCSAWNSLATIQC